MNDVVTIENTEMQIREYNGQRVVTFKDIDNAHGNKPGTARRNFNRNKKRFIEGEDYFFLTKEISNETILPISNISVPNRGITILTESGYLLISKSFNDDLSWNVQRQLVNTYFKAKQERDIFTNTTQKIPFRNSMINAFKRLLNPCNCLKHSTAIYNCQCADDFLTAHALYFALHDVLAACAVLLTA